MSNALEDRLDRDAEAWRPEPGDKLVGTVTDVGEFEGEYGAYPVIEVQTADGAYSSWHAFHTVAKNEVSKVQPKVGDAIGVKYQGKVPTKPGSKYASYEKWTVKVDKADGSVPDAPDWDAHRKEAQRELEGNGYQPGDVDTDEEPF